MSTTTGIEQDIDVSTFKAQLFGEWKTDDGKDHKTHIVNPPKNLHIWQPGMTAQEIVDIARVTGQEVTALCGYKWVPKRNPDKYDVCQPCMDIAGELMRGNGE